MENLTDRKRNSKENTIISNSGLLKDLKGPRMTVHLVWRQHLEGVHLVQEGLLD